MAHNAGVCAVAKGSPTIPKTMAYTQNYAPFLLLSRYFQFKKVQMKKKVYRFFYLAGN